jgi:FKBP-type peptidyl-prolyl cis-trans isomerase FkpA
MMFRNKVSLVLGAMVLLIAGCKKGVLTTKSGLEYEYITDNGKVKASEGDIITVLVTISNYKDSVLQASKEPMTFPVPKASGKGNIEDGFSLLGEGDSVIFKVPTDSLFKGAPPEQRPAFLPPGSKLKYGFKVIKLETAKQAKENNAKKLEEFKAKNGFANATVTASGLSYIIRKEGTGITPMPGDTVSVDYEGKFLDGKVFDASSRHGAPYTFPVGMQNVIPGWDEGLLLLKEGTEATFLIPSNLAYGEAGSPPTIPANAALVFDIKLVKVSKPKAAANKK